MNSEMYAILAMAARYFFAALMALIVVRAWRITQQDNRRWRWLRERSQKTGCVGELLFHPGKGKRPLQIPIPREGVIGSSRKADIRLKFKDVARMHAHIEEREGGLLVRPLGRSTVAIGDSKPTNEPVFAQDGDTLCIGKQCLMIVMFEASAKPIAAQPDTTTANARHQTVEPIEPFDDIYDEFFDEDVLWPDESNPKSTR